MPCATECEHGQCNEDSGTCVCGAGWDGPACDHAAPLALTTQCILLGVIALFLGVLVYSVRASIRLSHSRVKDMAALYYARTLAMCSLPFSAVFLCVQLVAPASDTQGMLLRLSSGFLRTATLILCYVFAEAVDLHRTRWHKIWFTFLAIATNTIAVALATLAVITSTRPLGQQGRFITGLAQAISSISMALIPWVLGLRVIRRIHFLDHFRGINGNDHDGSPYQRLFRSTSLIRFLTTSVLCAIALRIILVVVMIINSDAMAADADLRIVLLSLVTSGYLVHALTLIVYTVHADALASSQHPGRTAAKTTGWKTSRVAPV